MEILDEKEYSDTEMFTPGNVIKDGVGDYFIIITVKKYDKTSGVVVYSGYGATNIESGETFLYDTLEDLKCVLKLCVKKTVHGKHTVDFDIKGEG